MKLRNYQEKAIERILESWKKFRSCLIVLPTGCGKTVVFGELIHRILAAKAKAEGEDEQRNGQDSVRAMILAHREELITQAADKVGRISGADVQIEMGDMKVSPMFGQMPHVVVSTVQTQTAGGGQVEVGGRGRGRRMDKFDPADFGVLVIDEAHHATAKSYRTCIEHYLSNPKCRLLGVTATPDRADESALGNVFDIVAFEYTVTEAIRDGWLVPVKQRLVKVDSLDFSKVSSCAGDFNQGELAQVLEEEQNLHSIAVPTVEICGNRRTIIFAASVKQAERLAEILNRGKSEELRGKSEDGSTRDRAAWVCGMTPKDERRQILEDFKAGRIQYLVNVGVLTEGYDDAGVEVVVMARPTKSRALYAQMAGRATRPAAEIAAKLGEIESKSEVEVEQRNLSTCASGLEGETNHHCSTSPSNFDSTNAAALRRALIASSSKPECTILDFVGNSGRHKLVSSVDILGGKDIDEDEEEARRRAKKRCEESGEAVDMIAVLEKSREEIRREKTEQAKRRNFIQATAKFIEVSVDPFNIFDLPPVEESVRCPLGRSLSWRQKELLREKLKIDPDRIGAAHARQLLDEYFRRVNEHLATFGQMKMLRKFGVAVPMRFDEASRTLNRLLRKAS